MLRAQYCRCRTVTLTATAIAFTVLACSDQGGMSDEDVAKVEHALEIGDVAPVYDVNRVRDVMQELVDLGPRTTGSDIERTAAKVIRKKFESFGLTVAVEDYPVATEWRDNCGSLLKFKRDAIKPMHVLPMSFSPPADIRAPMVHVDLGYPDQYPQGKTGYIALIRRGAIPLAFKAQYAFEAGAIAAVVYNNVHVDGALPPFNAATSPIPIGSVTLEDGQEVLAALSKGAVTATLQINTKRALGTTRQVIATLPGTDATERTLYVTAHYDSAPMPVKFDPNNSPKSCAQTFSTAGKKGSPGANDNASGVAALVEVARVLSTLPRPKANVKLIAFGGEEAGLSGSVAYVLAHRTQIDAFAVGEINLDMVGAGQYLLFGNLSSPPDLMEFAINKALPISDLYIPTGLPQQSDHAAFEWRGVPSMSLTRMIGEEPNPIFFVDYPHYHQPTDTMDKVSVELVEAAGEFVTLVAHDYADLP